MASASVTRSYTMDGGRFDNTVTVESEFDTGVSKLVPGAKAGTLTARTNNTDGTLTLSASHGVATGDKFDLFWEGGARHGVTAGTVSGTSVPFSGGAGDNLPTQGAIVRANEGVTLPLAVTGDKVVALEFCGLTTPGDGAAYVVFLSAGGAVIYAQYIPTGSRGWVSGEGGANPLAGQAAASVRFSHQNTGDRQMRVTVFYNS